MAEHTHTDALEASTPMGTTVAPDRTAAATPNDPDAARVEIERTRARMSETIDEIEEALLRKKEDIQDRLDVMAPVRQQPLKILGAVFGAGLVLGLLTGGDDEDEDDLDFDAHLGYRERASTWESRARRLMRIAEEQEAELERLRGLQSMEEDDPEEDEIHSRRGALGDQLSGGASRMVSRYVEQMVRRMLGAA